MHQRLAVTWKSLHGNGCRFSGRYALVLLEADSSERWGRQES